MRRKSASKKTRGPRRARVSRTSKVVSALKEVVSTATQAAKAKGCSATFMLIATAETLFDENRVNVKTGKERALMEKAQAALTVARKTIQKRCL